MSKPPMLKKCLKCPLVEANQFVPAEHPLHEPKLIVFAEAPGATEVEKGRPLVGMTGTLYRKTLSKVGGNPLSCVHLNVVNCRPPGNSKPTAPMIRRCREYVDTILADYPDLPILLLGDVAGRSFIVKEERFQITRDRGYAYDTNADREGFLTFHPSFISRCSHYDTVAVETWEHDLQRAWEWGVGNFRYQNEFDYRVGCNQHDIIDYVYTVFEPGVKYETGKLLAVDIETTGLNPRVDKILGISFCNKFNDAVSVPWPTVENEVYDAIQFVLADVLIPKVFQNGLFDIEFLTLNGMEVNNYAFDTRYAHHCTLPDGSRYLKPHSLRFMNSIYTNMPPYKSEYTEIYGGAANVDVDTVQELACHDANAALQIAAKLLVEHRTLGLETYFRDVLMPIMPVLNDMHVRGVRIEARKLLSLREAIMPNLRRIEAALPGVNLNSPKQIAAHLRDVGVNLTKKTPTGQYKVDAEVLKDLIDREENQETADQIRLLLDYHDLKKIEGTYCTGLLKRLHNGRLHTSFSIGPSTGRLASSDPNLQNVPEEVRHVFIPDEGMSWVKADYEQIELYVAALEYEDDNLLRALKSGADIHDRLQRTAFGKNYDASNARQRRIAKTVVFGTIYGRGSRAIAIAFGVPVETARGWQDNFFEAYPTIRESQKRLAREAEKTGIVRSAFGNIRQTREYTKIVNHPVQGGAAGVLCIALQHLRRYSDLLQPLLTVHDEIDFQVPHDQLDHHIECIKSCMSAPVPQYGQFQFPVHIEVGDSWALQTK